MWSLLCACGFDNLITVKWKCLDGQRHGIKSKTTLEWKAWLQTHKITKNIILYRSITLHFLWGVLPFFTSIKQWPEYFKIYCHWLNTSAKKALISPATLKVVGSQNGFTSMNINNYPLIPMCFVTIVLVLIPSGLHASLAITNWRDSKDKVVIAQGHTISNVHERCSVHKSGVKESLGFWARVSVLTEHLYFYILFNLNAYI